MDQEFIKWATKLGCPPENIPSESKLKSTFRASQTNVWFNLMTKVQDAQTVKNIRRNILLSKLKQIPNDRRYNVPLKFMPPEIRNYFEIQQLKEKSISLKRKIETDKKEEEAILERISLTGIKKQEVQKNVNEASAKLSLMKIKQQQLDKQIEAEKELQKKLERAVPIKLSVSNNNEDVANESIKKCFEELNKFYSNFEACSNNDRALQSLKSELWKKMKDLLHNIPNCLAWENLLKSLENCMESIVRFSKDNDSNSNKNLDTRKQLENILTKIHAMHLKSGIEICTKKAEFTDLSNVLTEIIESVNDNVEFYFPNIKNLSAFHDEDELITDYLSLYLQKLFIQGQVMNTQKEIDSLKLENANNKVQLAQMGALIDNVESIYMTMSSAILKLQSNIAQHHQIKEKLIFSKVNMMYMFQDMKRTNAQLNRTLMNQTVIARSFDMTLTEDFNAQLNSEITLPKYFNEVQLFIEIPMEKFDRKSWSVQKLIKPNLILFSHINKNVVTINSIRLLNANGILLKIKTEIEWNKKIVDRLKDLAVTGLEFDEISIESLKKLQEANNDNILEMLDKIANNNIKTKATIKKLNRYQDFLSNNPLRKFVDPKRTFNGRTYIEYEDDYQMYYRMLK